MAIYRYVKAPIVIILPSNKTTSHFSRLLAPILLTLGSIMLANVIWPILSYQLINSPKLQKINHLSPVPQSELSNYIKTPSITPITDRIIPKVLSADLDYTQASNWFIGSSQITPEKPTSYRLSIPSINITNALVTLGGEDLNYSLIQYATTAMPGELGSPVIFGHSVLRQFYDPKETNPKRYLSIFSKIMTLKNGDRIFVDYDSIRYTYEVQDKTEVEPKDLFILEQRYSKRELKLITCVPEGTYLRRGVIVATLVDLQQ